MLTRSPRGRHITHLRGDGEQYADRLEQAEWLAYHAAEAQSGSRQPSIRGLPSVRWRAALATPSGLRTAVRSAEQSGSSELPSEPSINC